MKRKTNPLVTVLLAAIFLLGSVSTAAALPNNNIFNNGMQNNNNIPNNSMQNNYNMQNNNNLPNNNMKQITNGQENNNDSDITVILNGKKMSFDVPPTIDNGTTLVPMRAIMEALGAQVQWNGNSNTVTAVKGSNMFKLTIGQKKAYKNGSEVNLNVAGRVVNGRTLVPIRFVSETIGANVNWDAAARTITIITPDTTTNSTGSDETSVTDLEEAMTNYLEYAGAAYFSDQGIDTTFSLSGDEDNLAYTVKLDFDDADYYDNLKDISQSKLKGFLNAINTRISSAINGTDYEDADITGKLYDSNNSSYYVKYNGSSYTFSWDDSDDSDLSDIEDELNDYFDDAGNDYFDDDGIDVKISLDGDEDDIYYSIKLDFDDADDYSDLTDVSQSDLKTFLNKVKSEINSEIDGTDYEDADISGKLVDNDDSSYYVKYNGSSYTFSWD